ncbi:MAG TPA: carboxypeptidase regulatory-like domain-containing protein [Bryobacteraceae bacterium]|nr:carboxypeptidase regulatory-like domain-containing protein [Bryobacteraceae bacterium]
MNSTKTFFLAGCLSALAASSLLAQSTGSLRGQVTDPSGAGIPGATVTLTGPANTVKVATTDATGAYTIVGLPGGTFTVRVAAPGFNLFEKTNLELNVGRGATLDVPLTVAVEKQEVTVQDSQGIQIDPEKNAGAIILKGEDLDFLSDDPDDLQADLLALAGPAVGPNGGQIYIDGFSNGQLPPKENIREIRINSNPFSAEFDTMGFGRIEIFTKPGTDKFGGSLLLEDMDGIFNSRNPFSNTSRPNYSQKQTQATLRGPLTSKASFNIDFQYRKQDLVSLIQAKDPTDLPASFAEIPSFTGTSIYSWYPDYSTRYQVSPRIDYQLTKNITLSGRYSFNHTNSPNGGIGNLNLPTFYSPATGSLANQETVNTGHTHTAQLTETQVIGARAVNESRFQYQKNDSNNVWNNALPNVTPVDPIQVNVSGAFDIGGAAAALTYLHRTNYEYQNITSLTRNKHFIKFGVRIRGQQESSFTNGNFNGTYTFAGVNCLSLLSASSNPYCAANPGGLISSLQSYAITQLGLAQGMSMAQIRALGGGPTQYSVAGGQPLTTIGQVDAAPFVQDDWRIVPSITLSLGLRYEVQDNIGNKNALAPRVGLAWGLGGGQGRGRNPKTVIRAGYGVFYDRVAIGLPLAAIRQNGIVQQTYLLQYPTANPALDVYPNALTPSQLAGFQQPQNLQKLYAGLQAPQYLQAAVGLDRQLSKNITLSVNVIDTRGVHVLRDVDLNAPIPGTYNPRNPSAAVYPYAALYGNGIVNFYESSGLFKQLQVQNQIRMQLNNRVNLFGYYVFGEAHGDADGGNGGGSFPSNPYNFAQDWGRTSFDRRGTIQLGGNITAPFRITLSPNINYTTAPPLNITDGQDLYGDGQFNARPAFATPSNAGCNGQGIISTPWGMFNENPLQNPACGSVIIPRNYASAYGSFRFNLRIGRTWGFGERVSRSNPQGNFNPGDQGGGNFGGGGRGPGFGGGGRGGFGGGGRGGRGGGGNQSSGQRYTLNLNIQLENVFNTVNQPAPVAVLTSPFLGQSLVGGNGLNALANRRVNINLRFSF